MSPQNAQSDVARDFHHRKTTGASAIRIRPISAPTIWILKISNIVIALSDTNVSPTPAPASEEMKVPGMMPIYVANT